MIYLNVINECGKETMDAFETRKEAHAVIKETRLSDASGNYYLSSRACKHWYESMRETEQAKKQLKNK